MRGVYEGAVCEVLFLLLFHRMLLLACCLGGQGREGKPKLTVSIKLPLRLRGPGLPWWRSG